jgi:lysophospholipase L1-like esterase
MKPRDFLVSATSVFLAPASRALAADPLRMLVIGDSVLWGQGLWDDQKMHNLVAQQLVAGGAPWPQIFHYAVSGATIGFKDGQPLSGASVWSWWPRELPKSNPTLYEQCLQVQADHPKQLFDLILVVGGINDVDVRTIFDPLTSTSDITKACQLYCNGAMSDLLEVVRATFLAANPNARVLVLGYYDIFSPLTQFPDITKVLEVLIAETFSPPGFHVETARPLTNPIDQIEDILRRNAKAFREGAHKNLSAAVDAANVKAPGRYTFVDPAFTADEAAFAPNRLVFGLDSGELAEDPRAQDRKRFCAEEQITPGPARFQCDRASMGHPNVAGAQKYAQAIMAKL